MPFTPGGTDNDDGGVGTTRSSSKSGLFGRNDATAAPPSGTPGGAGVFGLTVSPGAAGVFGANNNATTGRGVQGNGPEAGVGGFSQRGVGVVGHGREGDGMAAHTWSSSRNGILGRNNATNDAPSGGPPKGNGVFGYTDVPNAAGVCGAVAAGNTRGAGIVGIGPTAARFFGNVVVTGDVELTGADCAEEFDVTDAELAMPGSVMVLDDSGALRVSDREYDSRVAGVISGAGSYAPGVILDRGGSGDGRRPVALVGKVFCRLDAARAPIEVGDLLTTSDVPGHAMKAADRSRAFGSIIGKALRPLRSGRELVPILVALQ